MIFFLIDQFGFTRVFIAKAKHLIQNSTLVASLKWPNNVEPALIEAVLKDNFALQGREIARATVEDIMLEIGTPEKAQKALAMYDEMDEERQDEFIEKLKKTGEPVLVC